MLAQDPVSRDAEPVFRPADSMPSGPVQFQKTGSNPAQDVVQTQAKTKPKDRDALPDSGSPRTQTEDLLEYQIRLEPPSIEVVTGMGSEKSLEERMRQEAIQRGGQEVRFPAKAPVATKPYTPRAFVANRILAEPRYVSYDRLHFEELNAERYGWDFGFVQPLVSAAYFYKDVLFLPARAGAYPFRRFETSAGKCLPGDPVPYILYPPELTLTGLAAEAGVVVGLTAVFP